MKNLIRKTLGLLAIMLTMALAVSAQSKPGPYVSMAVGTENGTREQRLLITVSPEAGIMGKYVGIAVVYNNTINLYKGSKVPHHNPAGKASSIGLKGMVNLFTVDALKFIANAEVDRIIDPIDRKINGDYMFKPGVKVAVNIYQNLDAGIEWQETIYRQGPWKDRQGGKISVNLRF